MTDPQKVLGFLDIAAIPDARWDPSLALVMAGGLLVAFPIFRFAKSRNAAVCGGKIELPTRRDIDRNLVIGGLMFGIGWGMVGYCPGPAPDAALPYGTNSSHLKNQCLSIRNSQELAWDASNLAATRLSLYVHWHMCKTTSHYDFKGPA